MPVGNQGNVGSCAAWATVYAAMGYYLNLQGIPGGPLAPMYTYAQLSEGVDEGSYPADNLEIAQTQGVDSRVHYGRDYDFTTQPSPSEVANAAHWRVSDFEDLDVWQSQPTNQPELKAALADGRPVVISFPVYSDFDAVRTANDGLYTHTGGTFRGYHAVAALGYDASGLRIQNSWGTSWVTRASRRSRGRSSTSTSTTPSRSTSSRTTPRPRRSARRRSPATRRAAPR